LLRNKQKKYENIYAKIAYSSLKGGFYNDCSHCTYITCILQKQDYNCSVEFFWSPFLVKLETKINQTRALKLDQLPAMLQRTLGADVLIFNTGDWWTHTGKLRA